MLKVDRICQCGSCENIFNELELVKNDCPHCGSGNWVRSYIDEEENSQLIEAFKSFLESLGYTDVEFETDLQDDDGNVVSYHYNAKQDNKNLTVGFDTTNEYNKYNMWINNTDDNKIWWFVDTFVLK